MSSGCGGCSESMMEELSAKRRLRVTRRRHDDNNDNGDGKEKTLTWLSVPDDG